MRVEKWYLDCVAADGAGMLGYAARLGWGPLAVRCSETLRWGAGQSPAEGRIVIGGEPPEETSTGVVWRNPALDLAGSWSPLGAALPPLVLHEEVAGRIEWRCCGPAARVAVDLAGRRCEGLGYAEHLVMTLPAERMPLRELQWGRFVAAEANCVWIRWTGPIARSWCFFNGNTVAAEPGVGSGLRWPGHRLELAPGLTLRSGRVADTVFKRAPMLRRFFPSALGDLVETKWCCRGGLTDAQGRRHDGWVIHEVATFP